MRYRRTITIRLKTANDLCRMLKRVREDDYYYLTVNDRLQAAISTTPLTGRMDLRDSQQLHENEMERIQTDLRDVRVRIGAQQQELQTASDEVGLKLREFF